MNQNDYRLDAYKKASNTEKVKSISKQIRHNNEPGHEPLVHKPIFEHVDKKIGSILDQKQNDNRIETKHPEFLKTKKSVPTEDDVKKAADMLVSGGLIKVPESDSTKGKDNLYRRVAKFLLVIGIDEAAKIMPHLTEEQTERIIPEIASIRKITPEEAEAVLEEFESLVTKSREEGGIDTARTILSKAFGNKKAESMIEKTIPFADGKPFEYLEGIDSDRIELLLHDESVAVKSLVLSQIEPKSAAAVINKMDTEAKKEVILRLAKMRPVDPVVIENIDKTLHEKMLSQNTQNSQNLDGRGALAQILKRMDPTVEQNIINNLSEQDPDLGADLRQRLFTEEDVISSDDKFIQNILRNMEDGDIALLIAGKNDDFRQKILSDLSITRGKLVLEEEDIRKPMKRSDCEKITSQFYSVLRRAWEDGKLIIKNRDDGEIYV